MMTKEFNLLDEKWIVVLDGNGAATEVSMLEAFRNAHEYKRLANELPTADVAILRLLLAVMYAVFTHVDVNGDRSELTTDNALDRWKELWRGEQFPCKLIEQYLEQYRERFYLVHPETPFYQAASLSGRKCTEYEAPKLIGDLSQSGNKPRLFMGRTSSKSIPKPEATRWLLHVNAFDDTSAKPSVRKSAGSSADAMFAPGAGWLGKLGLITVSGENLFQTLLLNFVLINDKNEAYASGKPIWEVDVRDTERSKIPLPQGLAELYTLQSRRLLLKYSGNDVTGYYLLGGDAFNKENAFTEPMTLWRKSDNDYTPRRHNAGKQLWRDFGALVQGGDDFKIPGIVRWSEILSEENIIDTYSFSAVGIQFGDKDFFVDDVYADSLSVNGAIFSSVGSEWQAAIVEILNVTENAVKVFGTLASDLALAEGRDKGERGKNLFPIRDAAKERAYFSLDIPFRNWLSTIDTTGDMDDIMTAWKKQTREIIKGLADGMLNNMSDAAFIGHNGKTALEAEKWFNINLAKALELSGE
ncbi:MAG: type I-E CRISPR-associated protein Cse1/CasA [Clostridiales Family XIII bacterium]|nr:type I-E CRISPR-associated protein Cse1/CasA [Clostridiales Family XIII bacterium]